MQVLQEIVDNPLFQLGAFGVLLLVLYLLIRLFIELVRTGIERQKVQDGRSREQDERDAKLDRTLEKAVELAGRQTEIALVVAHALEPLGKLDEAFDRLSRRDGELSKRDQEQTKALTTISQDLNNPERIRDRLGGLFGETQANSAKLAGSIEAKVEVSQKTLLDAFSVLQQSDVEQSEAIGKIKAMVEDVLVRQSKIIAFIEEHKRVWKYGGNESGSANTTATATAGERGVGGDRDDRGDIRESGGASRGEGGGGVGGQGRDQDGETDADQRPAVDSTGGDNRGTSG